MGTNGNVSATRAARGVFLLTHPRSASNLFQKMLANQPVHQSGYFFYDAAVGLFAKIPRGPLSDMDESERRNAYDAYHTAGAKLRDELGTATAKGLGIMVKEHTCFLYGPDTIWRDFYPQDKRPLPPLTVSLGEGDQTTFRSNPTCLPDKVLLSLQPVFQIRSPLLMFPSLVRAARAAGFPHVISKDPNLTLRYSRRLYDWYAASESGPAPLVIDADDIMGNPAVVRHLCVLAGLDPAAIRYDWEVEEEKNPFKAKFLSTINGSTGILPGLDSHGLTLEGESAKWKVEFGEQDGGELADLVGRSMPDYEYMWERRVVPAS